MHHKFPNFKSCKPVGLDLNKKCYQVAPKKQKQKPNRIPRFSDFDYPHHHLYNSRTYIPICTQVINGVMSLFFTFNYSYPFFPQPAIDNQVMQQPTRETLDRWVSENSQGSRSL